MTPAPKSSPADPCRPSVSRVSRPKPAAATGTRMGRWRAAVLIGVHVLIAAHIAHWLSAGSTITPVEPSEAMALGQYSVVNTGLIFFAAMILLTAVFGRYFCGWACHVVALQDLCRHWMLKLGITPKPLRSRVLAWVPTLAFLYMFVWPAVWRWWHGDDLSIRAVELTTSAFWATFPGWVIGILTLLICGFACVYFLGAKGFCTYACPYGAIFAAADRVAPLRIRVTDACSQCGQCTAVCSSNVRVHEEVRDYRMVVSPGCMKCRDCVAACPTGALYYGAGPIPLMVKAPPERKARPPAKVDWLDEALLAGGFLAGFLILRGLYGVVPFLMALGCAAVVAFLLLTTTHLWRRPQVERAGLRLKRNGRLLPQGRVYVGLMAGLLAFLVHSAILRTQDALGQGGFDASLAARMALLARPGVPPDPGSLQGLDLSAAIRHLQRVDQWGLWPTHGNAGRLAWLQVLRDEPDAARHHAVLARERDEWAYEMDQLLAHVALLEGDVTTAHSNWRVAQAREPQRREAWLAHGLHLAQQGQLVAAQDVFENGLRAVGADAELTYNSGLAMALSGQLESSLERFQQALALRADYREARENLAGVYASLGRYGEAIAQFRIALQQAPDDLATRVLLARALAMQGDVVAARTELDAVLRSDATNVDAITLYRLLDPAGTP